MKESPAIVVFGREPVPGRAKTRLLSHLGPGYAAALADAFFLDTIAKAAALRPSRLVVAGTAQAPVSQSAYFRDVARRFRAELLDQGDGDLGHRMERSLRPYREGAGALLVGTDLPSLPISVLHRLVELLLRRRIVIGPSLDGGFYAVGVRGPMPPMFDGVRWNTSNVLDQTVAAIKRAGRAVTLGPVWYDVDRWGELILLGAHLARIETTISGATEHPCPRTASVMRRLGLLPRRR